MHYFIITGIEQKEFETFIDLAVSRILDGEVDDLSAFYIASQDTYIGIECYDAKMGVEYEGAEALAKLIELKTKQVLRDLEEAENVHNSEDV